LPACYYLSPVEEKENTRAVHRLKKNQPFHEFGFKMNSKCVRLQVLCVSLKILSV
jgi:hypothetical protein